MSEFINSVDTLGDAALTDSIINRSIEELISDNIGVIGNYALAYCQSLTKADCPNAISIGSYAFYKCTALNQVNFPNVTSVGAEIFSGVTSLTYVKFPKLATIAAHAFRSCTNLAVADFDVAKSIDHNAFTYTPLATLILRKTDKICELLYASSFYGTAYIYVPSALLDTYKAATNWSTYADQFRALEDYTVDGTTTGELDETKI